ncbi:MAG: arsenate reductase ArsC [Candidatus Thiodiazotropha sp.]
MPDKIVNVLFLCTGNSARSILAECILNRLGEGKFHAFSAGSHPRGEVHPLALEELARHDYDTVDLRSKDWNEFDRADSPPMDFVFTVCDNAAAEVCPVWSGQPVTAHWGLEDPAEVAGDEVVKKRAFARAYRELHNRISLFVNLSFESSDKLSLQQELNRIGRIGLPESKEGRA